MNDLFLSEYLIVKQLFIIIFLISILLVLFMFYTAWLSAKFKNFDDSKYLLIIKDLSSLIILPLLINIFSNQLTKKILYVTYGLILILFGLYIYADIHLSVRKKSKFADPYIVKTIVIVILILIVVYFIYRFNADIVWWY